MELRYVALFVSVLFLGALGGFYLSHHLRDEQAEKSVSNFNLRQRPNVVLIMVDDLGYSDLGFTGSTEVRTPNIDRLARDGVVFTNGYSPSAICSPARAGLMTGRNPSRFGLESNIVYAPFDPNMGLPIEEETLADHLHAVGYRTGLYGKWHLGAAENFHPMVRGFDKFLGFWAHNALGFPEVEAVSDNRPDVTTLVENYEVRKFDGHITDVLTDGAMEFIGDGGERDPFFLYLSYRVPHSWVAGAPPALLSKYANAPTENRQRYLALIENLDRNIGRLVNHIDRSGMRDSTVIFFLNDNGAPLLNGITDNTPFYRGKNSFYEGGIRVPFLANWPQRWPQGLTYNPMVSTLDIVPTVLALAGIDAVDSDRPLDGVNLDPFLRGESDGEPHDGLFWRAWSSNTYAVRSGDMKMLMNHKSLILPNSGDGHPQMPQLTGEAELYNLRRDPGETTNLIWQMPEVAKEMAEMWNEWNQHNSRTAAIPGWMYQLEFQNLLRRMNYQDSEWSEDWPLYRIDLESLLQPTETASTTADSH